MMTPSLFGGANSLAGKMTEEQQADSLEFLRSRGVLVETPEDRAGAADAAKELSGLQVGAPNTRSFRCVSFREKEKEKKRGRRYEIIFVCVSVPSSRTLWPSLRRGPTTRYALPGVAAAAGAHTLHRSCSFPLKSDSRGMPSFEKKRTRDKRRLVMRHDANLSLGPAPLFLGTRRCVVQLDTPLIRPFLSLSSRHPFPRAPAPPPLSPCSDGSYVKIPADDSTAVSEVTGVVYSDARGVGDKLPLMLAPGFSSGAVDAAALKQRTAEHMAGGYVEQTMHTRGLEGEEGGDALLLSANHVYARMC